MKINNTVKTKERANQIILAYISDNNLKEGYFRNTTAHCECGETDCLTWYNGEILLSVAICENCGDDDAIVNEILEIS